MKKKQIIINYVIALIILILSIIIETTLLFGRPKESMILVSLIVVAMFLFANGLYFISWSNELLRKSEELDDRKLILSFLPEFLYFASFLLPILIHFVKT